MSQVWIHVSSIWCVEAAVQWNVAILCTVDRTFLSQFKALKYLPVKGCFQCRLFFATVTMSFARVLVEFNVWRCTKQVTRVEHSRTMQNHVLLHTFDFTTRVILPGTWWRSHRTGKGIPPQMRSPSLTISFLRLAWSGQVHYGWRKRVFSQCQKPVSRNANDRPRIMKLNAEYCIHVFLVQLRRWPTRHSGNVRVGTRPATSCPAV